MRSLLARLFSRRKLLETPSDIIQELRAMHERLDEIMFAAAHILSKHRPEQVFVSQIVDFQTKTDFALGSLIEVMRLGEEDRQVRERKVQREK